MTYASSIQQKTAEALSDLRRLPTTKLSITNLPIDWQLLFHIHQRRHAPAQAVGNLRQIDRDRVIHARRLVGLWRNLRYGACGLYTRQRIKRHRDLVADRNSGDVLQIRRLDLHLAEIAQLYDRLSGIRVLSLTDQHIANGAGEGRGDLGLLAHGLRVIESCLRLCHARFQHREVFCARSGQQPIELRLLRGQLRIAFTDTGLRRADRRRFSPGQQLVQL